MAARSVGTFLERFVLPLVQGGELHVGAPYTPAEFNTMAAELDGATQSTEAIDDARQLVLGQMLAKAPPQILDADDLSLAVALHNALYLAHPKANQWTVSDKGRRRVVDASLYLASVPLTKDRRRVLGRHGLLWQLFAIERADTTVSWWTGSARFFGQPPPRRLMSWSNVRRVETHVTKTGFADLLATPDAAPITATIARRSPLTQLLCSSPHAPPLHWEDATFLLRDAELARAIAYGLTQPDRLDGLWRAATAFEQMLERNPDPADVRAVAALLIWANGLLCYDEVANGNTKQTSAIMAAALAKQQSDAESSNSQSFRYYGASTLFALSSALSKVAPVLMAPPGLLNNPQVAERWAIHRATAQTMLGDGVIAALGQRLARHFGKIA